MEKRETTRVYTAPQIAVYEFAVESGIAMTEMVTTSSFVFEEHNEIDM